MARLIREIMADWPLDRRDIKRKYEKQTVHGHAVCRACTECGKSWSSHLSWLTLNLRQQRIVKRWVQKCKDCNTINTPWFSREELEHMIKFAINRYIKLEDGTYDTSSRDKPERKQAPHESSLCERCGFGKRKCWEPYTKIKHQH